MSDDDFENGKKLVYGFVFLVVNIQVFVAYANIMFWILDEEEESLLEQGWFPSSCRLNGLLVFQVISFYGIWLPAGLVHFLIRWRDAETVADSHTLRQHRIYTLAGIAFIFLSLWVLTIYLIAGIASENVLACRVATRTSFIIGVVLAIVVLFCASVISAYRWAMDFIDVESEPQPKAEVKNVDVQSEPQSGTDQEKRAQRQDTDADLDSWTCILQ